LSVLAAFVIRPEVISVVEDGAVVDDADGFVVDVSEGATVEDTDGAVVETPDGCAVCEPDGVKGMVVAAARGVLVVTASLFAFTTSLQEYFFTACFCSDDSLSCFLCRNAGGVFVFHR
jgi:hypothetical protein